MKRYEDHMVGLEVGQVERYWPKDLGREFNSRDQFHRVIDVTTRTMINRIKSKLPKEEFRVSTTMNGMVEVERIKKHEEATTE